MLDTGDIVTNKAEKRCHSHEVYSLARVMLDNFNELLCAIILNAVQEKGLSHMKDP